MFGLAASIGLICGWRLYIVFLAIGLALRFGFLPHPANWDVLQWLASPWLLGAASIACFVEFSLDKSGRPYSLWDAAHALLRPIGAGLLALALLDRAGPAMAVFGILAACSGALLSHAAKSAARAAIASMPGRNTAAFASTLEDIAIAALLAIAILWPAASLAAALAVSAIDLALLLALRRVLGAIIGDYLDEFRSS